MTRITKFSFFFLFFSLFFIVLSADAQSGWDQVKANDNRAARTLFSAVLEKDSMDEQALKGMIYLSEIEQDNLSFNKYVSRLLKKSDDEILFLVFEDFYTGKADDIIKKTSLSEKARMSSKVGKAGELEHDRKFDEARKMRRELFPQLKWSFIGPFKNIAGSGHVTEHPIEKESFSENKTYRNPFGIDLRWVKPAFITDDGRIDPEDYSMQWGERSVYYANAFFDMPQAKRIQVRIAREAPMKIWLDDFLVFENKDEVSWDTEIVTLDLPAGTHRLLVKLSSAVSPPKSYRFLEFNPSGGYYGRYDFGGMFDYGDLFGGGDYGGGGDHSFCIRFTDETGAPVNISAAASGNYSRGNYKATASEQSAIPVLRERVNKNPDDLFGWYMLCRAALDSRHSQQAEEWLVAAWRKQPNLVFMKYLCARVYARNGKVEKTYDMLNDIDQEKTPIFGDLYKKFQDIDLSTDPDRYLDGLKLLNSVTPSNYSVIQGFISYYNTRGLQQEKEEYLKKMTERFPEYKETLEWELTRDENRPDKEQTDKEREKYELESVQNTKKRFVTYDYTEAIQHFKEKANTKKVLALYNELIEIIPSRTFYRKEKAEFLYAEGRFDDALKELENVLAINPYSMDAIEQMGDIWYDRVKNNKENQQKALAYYHQAKALGSGSYSLDEKIEKIEGLVTYKKLFTTKNFDDVLADPGWKSRYQDEESIVLMYTRDLILTPDRNVEVYQQFMVKVLNDNGAKKWTEYNFGFLGNLNTVKVKKANGTEFTPDQRGGYVVIKNLSPGDIIMLDGVYKWSGYEEQLDTAFSMTHYVAFDVPIWYKKFEVAIPEGRYLNTMTHLTENKYTKTAHDKFDFYRWEYSDVPKAENEEAILDSYDPYPTVSISTLPDWSRVVEWYQQKTYSKFDLTYDVREALDSIIRPNMSAQEKVDAVYNYLTKEIKYSYVPFLQSGYTPKDPELTLSGRIGDCKDVATLMIAMLRSLNIESYYTLVKTNAFNHQDMLPALSFDHVVACVILDGEKRFYDLTTDFYPSYVLTENDLGAYGLLIKDGEKDLFLLPDDDLNEKKNKVVYEIDAKLGSNGTLDISANTVMPGIAGGSMREVFAAGISELEKRNYLSSMLGAGNYQNLSLTDYQLKNTLAISEPLSASYQLKAEEYSDEVVGLLICPLPWLSSLQSSSVISSKSRRNRLDVSQICYAGPMTQKVTLRMPKGYKLMRVPQNVSIDNKFGRYELKFKLNSDGSLSAEKYQQFKVNKIEPKDFAEFKTFYLQLLKQDRMKIAIQQL
ncbi:MAG: transglutaminase [Bacteroidetes bacterium]|nr:MAG: transglutaminase [Bacteroidota bacterium]